MTVNYSPESNHLLRHLALNRFNSLKKYSSSSTGGYVLQVALVAFLLLIIGTVAFASRTYSGFFGSIFQSANREARDVAESAITEFQATLNREENRYLLVYPSTSWATTSVNPCTGTFNASTGTATGGTAVDQTKVINRFKPDTTLKDLTTSSNTISTKQFYVESIEYRDSARRSYTAAPDSLLRGAARGLIRVTIIGSVSRNGVASTARVTREFEVVPKCCKRSFGKNTYGGANWGRDSRTCAYKSSISDGGNGIIGALNSGGLGGSSNNIPIVNENGQAITEAICYAGRPANSSSTDLGTSANAACIDGTEKVSNVSYNPLRFDLKLPTFPSGGTPATEQEISLGGGNGSNHYIYYSTSWQAIRRCQASVTSGTVSSISNCTFLSGSNSRSDDPCVYSLGTQSVVGTSAPRPYNEASCRLERISVGGRTLWVDTTGARINLFFNQTGPRNQANDNYDFMPVTGAGVIRRVHCYANNYRAPSDNRDGLLGLPMTNYTNDTDEDPSGPSATPCGQIPSPDKSTYVGSFSSTQAPGFFALCRDLNPSDYSTTGFAATFGVSGTGPCLGWDMLELLNVYTLSTGKFSIAGNASGVGFNIYAPKASVTLNGLSGNSSLCPSFMGRLWADSISLSGMTSSGCSSNTGVVMTPTSNPYFCGNLSCPELQTPSLFDFVARSYSHASGY